MSVVIVSSRQSDGAVQMVCTPEPGPLTGGTTMPAHAFGGGGGGWHEPQDPAPQRPNIKSHETPTFMTTFRDS